MGNTWTGKLGRECDQGRAGTGSSRCTAGPQGLPTSSKKTKLTRHGGRDAGFPSQAPSRSDFGPASGTWKPDFGVPVWNDASMAFLRWQSPSRCAHSGDFSRFRPARRPKDSVGRYPGRPEPVQDAPRGAACQSPRATADRLPRHPPATPRVAMHHSAEPVREPLPARTDDHVEARRRESRAGPVSRRYTARATGCDAVRSAHRHDC